MANQVDEVCAFLHRRMQKKDFLVLDTETEGLQRGIIDLAIIGADGQVLFDSLIKNREPIEASAFRTHHISEAMLKDAPTFAQIWPRFCHIMQGSPYVFTYNLAFDLARLKYTAKRERINWAEQIDERHWYCLMLMYAEHWGEVSWSSGYRWQRLKQALVQQHLEHEEYHRALSDAQATYKLLVHLGSKCEPRAVKTEQL